MRSNYYMATTILLTGALLLSGCTTKTTTDAKAETSSSVSQTDTMETEDKTEHSQDITSEATQGERPADGDRPADGGRPKDGNRPTAATGATEAPNVTADEYFSSRDLSGEIDTANAVTITMNGNTCKASSDTVSISGSTVTITKEGTYILSGTLKNGSVIVNTSKKEKVQLVLKDVSIHSDTFAPIYVQQADKVFVTLADGTENTLSNGGTFTQIDDNNVDAVIFSKDDITLNGTGSLTIDSPAGHGIVGKDEVTIADGSYTITAEQTAIRANDSIAIANGSFTLKAGADGLHAENKDDDSLGIVYISGGSFRITAGDDGIHATTILQIDKGSYSITAAEGLEADYIRINDGDLSVEASDDGINASQKSSLYVPTVEINGGNITVVMGQGDTDGIDSNGNIVINGGTVDVTGNSTFDYDGTGTINGGTVIVNGQEVTTLPNQMMGGGHGSIRMPGQKGRVGGNFDHKAQPGQEGMPGQESMPGQMPPERAGGPAV